MLKYIGIAANEFDTYLDYALLSIVAIYMYHATPLEMGWLGACFALPFLFSSHFFGKLFDKGKIHQWRTILFTINTLATPLLIFTGNIYGLFAIAFVKTWSRCGLSISNIKLNKNDDESKRFFEIYGYLINISRVLVPLIVVYLYNLIGIWTVIVFSSALNFLSVLTSQISLKLQDGMHAQGIDAAGQAATQYSFFNEMKASKDLFYLVAGYTIANFAFFLSNDMLGLFFKTVGESENSIGIIISLLGVGGIIGTKLASLLNKTLRPVMILMASMLINSIAFFIFGFLNSEFISVYVFYFGIILIGISSGVTFFAIRLGVREIVGYQNVGKATGMIQVLSSVVAISMPIIGGYIASMYSLDVTFKLTSIILFVLLMTFFYVFYFSKQRR
ncbi:MFS transporter [Xenorhabdus mauleonii]|uniref:MFS transporter n=1 Tax=Xenorhabdus mauleonii TaxID=351675 RepID=A0A1I3PP75_9GAMM|nr:MFS transporter [Xenorhabdus mauleonii]PHM44738.1 MFS transporter [Xenorhabdus mauleonii]SFJ23130.1 Major Facilitator Superfamily protein [Xenorhabdus mauleonii]